MAYPGAKWRKQRLGRPDPEELAAVPVPLPVPQQGHPSRPPPTYTPVAVAHAVPQASATNGAALYAPVVSVAPAATATVIPQPSAPELPPPSAPPAPPMAAPISASSVYAPVGAVPRPLGYAQAPPPPMQQPQHRLPQQYPQQAMRPGARPQLPQGSAYYSQGNLQGAIPFSSSCAGRKKALFIGITYKGTRAALKGCVNDVKNLYQFVTRAYGFQRQEIRILTDDPSFTDGAPTRHNIIESMRWLVYGAQPGDSLLLHYSGHGGSVRDRNGDEVDNYDETILPLDHDRAGQILDDDIHDICVKPLPRGVRLTAIFDSCHSGSVMDLPFSYKIDGTEEIIQVDNTQKALGTLANAGMAYLMGAKTTAAAMALEGIGSLLFGNKTNEAARQRTEQQNQSPADVIQIGGCRDDQTSADARINGEASGALSWAFIQALSQSPHQHYAQLLKNMRQLLRGRYTQVPQISASHRIDLFTPFNM